MIKKGVIMKNINKSNVLVLMISTLIALSACSNNKTNYSTETSDKSKNISTQESIDELSISDWVGSYQLYNIPSSTSSLMFSGISIQSDGNALVYMNGAEIMANNQGNGLTGEVQISKSIPTPLSGKKIWGTQVSQNTPVIGENSVAPIEVTPNAYITITYSQETINKLKQKYGDNLNAATQTWISYESADGKNILTDGSETPTVLIPKTTIDTNNSGPSSTEVKEEMNFDEIKDGNYSSIEGTWKNTKGDIITITKDTIEASAFKTINGNAQATIKGLTINIPSQNDSQGNPRVVEEDNVYKGAPLYSKTLKVSVDDGSNSNASYNFLSLWTNRVNAISQIAFLPANKKPYNTQVQSDNESSSEDRIFLNVAQQPVIDVNNAYIKIK